MPHLVEIAWPTFGAILLWRSITKGDPVQKALHSFGAPTVALLQWYVPFFAGIFVVLAWTTYEIFWKYRAMDEETINENFVRIWMRNLTGTFNATDPESGLGFQHATTVPPWLSRLNLISQLACLPTFLVALNHAQQVVRSGAHLSKHEELQWKPSQLVNTILIVIAMPTVFSIMALRSSCRIWALITGVAERSDQLRWEQVVMREMGRYRGDMELAAAFQFSVVFSFARLSSNFVSDSEFFKEAVEAVGDDRFQRRAEEYRRTLQYPTFLAVYAFCIVGVLRCCLNFLVAEAHVYEQAEFMAYAISQQILTRVDTVFISVTILCVVNMIFICRMQDIQDNLGNADLKFQGTRALIVISQIQLNVISAFQVGSDLFETVKEHKEMMSAAVQWLFEVNLNMQKWTFNEYSAHLLHTSLLQLECLVIVIMNRFIWGTDILTMRIAPSRSFFRKQTPPAEEDEEEDEQHQTYLGNVMKDPESWWFFSRLQNTICRCTIAEKSWRRWPGEYSLLATAAVGQERGSRTRKGSSHPHSSRRPRANTRRAANGA